MLKKEMNLACINRKKALCLFSWFFGINHHLKPLFVDTFTDIDCFKYQEFQISFQERT